MAALVAESCNKAPLFAPTESTITLTASRLASAGNGDTELIATVIEQSGTPVQNGTTVIFTTTLGTIEPREARTKGGTATAILRAGAQSGTATVSAFSGSTRADDLTIEIAVTQTVILSVTPGSLPSSGGGMSHPLLKLSGGLVTTTLPSPTSLRARAERRAHGVRRPARACPCTLSRVGTRWRLRARPPRPSGAPSCRRASASRFA